MENIWRGGLTHLPQCGNQCQILILQSRNNGEVAQHPKEKLCIHETFPQLPNNPEKSKHRKLWEIVHPQNLGLVRSPFGNAETLIRNRNTHCEKVCHTRKSLIGHFLWNAKNFLRFCIFRKSFSWEGPQLEGGGGEGRPFRCEEGGEGLWWESWNWRDISESEPIVKKVRGSGSRMRISADIYSIQTALFSECSKAEPRWDDHLTTHIIKCYRITSFWLLGMSDCHISSLIMIRLLKYFHARSQSVSKKSRFTTKSKKEKWRHIINCGKISLVWWSPGIVFPVGLRRALKNSQDKRGRMWSVIIMLHFLSDQL